MIVEINTTPVFWANKEAYDSKKYRVIANQGSTRSSKTFSLCQLMVDIASNPSYGKKEISIVSPSLPHLKKGARKDVIRILEELQLFNENDFNRTDQMYTFPLTGSYIEFFGAEDSTKVRGPGRQILYINEANLISKETYLQLALRTSEVIFIDFNPADEFSYVYDIADKEGNKLIVSNYRNNLANLPKEQVEEIESLKDADDNLWKVFGLGLRGTSSETVFTHWKYCNTLPEGEIVYGLDFGYNHPSALVKIVFSENKAYAQEIIYESKLTTNELAERMKDLSIGYSEIFCDHSRPETIEELARCGLNVKKANKDVLEGIRKVKSTPLFVTNDSINLIKELKSYKWKTDKDGKVLDEPVKFHDDAVDALRYGLYSKLANPTIQDYMVSPTGEIIYL